MTTNQLRVEAVRLPVSNPWDFYAPPCPRCRLATRVFLWHPEGRLRWVCSRCKRRFDVRRRNGRA